MQFLRILAVLSLALTACGGKGHPAQPTVSTQECAAAGQSMSRILAATLPPDTDPSVTASLGGALERRCVEDVWSEDAQACVATAADAPSMDACDPLLTQAQKDALSKEMTEVAMQSVAGGASYGGTTYGGTTYGAPLAD